MLVFFLECKSQATSHTIQSLSVCTYKYILYMIFPCVNASLKYFFCTRHETSKKKTQRFYHPWRICQAGLHVHASFSQEVNFTHVPTIILCFITSTSKKKGINNIPLLSHLTHIFSWGDEEEKKKTVPCQFVQVLGGLVSPLLSYFHSSLEKHLCCPETNQR